MDKNKEESERGRELGKREREKKEKGGVRRGRDRDMRNRKEGIKKVRGTQEKNVTR